MSDRQKTGVTRRSFLKWTSAASAMAALPLSRQLHAATPAPAPTTPAQLSAAETGKAGTEWSALDRR
ncbi:hypothetical protein UA45_13800, partial [Morganella morganii]